jgi:subtilisin family serine protease
MVAHQAASANAAQRGHRYVASPVLLGETEHMDNRRANTVLTVADRHAVLVELNLRLSAGLGAASTEFIELFEAEFPEGTSGGPPPPERVSAYQRCWLNGDEIKALLKRDVELPDGTLRAREDRVIFRLWPDYVLTPHLDRSVRTVNADAAGRVYAASGRGVVWAVIDTGIDKDHPHFAGGNLTNPLVAQLHRDFTYLVQGTAANLADPDTSAAPPAGQSNGRDSGQSDARGELDPTPDPTALTDPVGHGTHVAAIIAGRTPADKVPIIATSAPTEGDLPQWQSRKPADGQPLAGVAPDTLLVSLRVLLPQGGETAITTSSAVIKALAWVRAVNDDGRQPRIHGVNLSLGCDWYPDDYAAGQSPLCREIDLLVATGVVVVVSAGNSGAAGTLTGGSSDVSGALSTITDPGNAEAAITVGSSHKEAPHIYGVSYTSSKGPTLDGRRKPDLVAPGEHIASAATGAFRDGLPPFANLKDGEVAYREESGTSQAAPHVSGAIAAFLSVRTEYIGRPQEVKAMFCAHTSDLNRHEFYQGAGLVDLMKVFTNL